MVAGSVLLIALLGSVGWPGRDYWQGDHLVFWAGSRAVLQGVSPYDVAWWEGLPAREGRPAIALPYRPSDGPPVTTAYPLWTFLVFVPFAALPYELAAAAWLVVQVLVVTVALIGLSFAIFERARAETVMLFGLVGGFQPTWILVGNGNVTGFMFGVLAAGFVAVLAQRPYLAGLLFGLLALKPHPFALLPAVVLLGVPSPARVVAGAVTTGAVLFVAALAAQPRWIAQWIAQVAAAGSARLSNATATTLDRLVDVPIVPPLVVFAAIASLVVWWHARRPPFETLFAAAVAVSLFVAPYGRSYDHLHLAIVAAVVLRCLAHAPRARSVGLVFLATVAGPVPWALYAVAFTRGGEEVSAFVPALFFVLVLLADQWPSAGAKSIHLPRACAHRAPSASARSPGSRRGG